MKKTSSFPVHTQCEPHSSDCGKIKIVYSLGHILISLASAAVVVILLAELGFSLASICNWLMRRLLVTTDHSLGVYVKCMEIESFKVFIEIINVGHLSGSVG